MRKVLGLALIILMFGFIFMPTVEANPIFKAQIVFVYDGDTYRLSDGRIIRLALTDSYEITGKGDWYDKQAKAAKSYAMNQCLNKYATIHVDSKQPKDTLGRTVAEVNCPYAFMNYQILANKYGTIDKRFCPISEFVKEWWAIKYGC